MIFLPQIAQINADTKNISAKICEISGKSFHLSEIVLMLLAVSINLTSSDL